MKLLTARMLDIWSVLQVDRIVSNILRNLTLTCCQQRPWTDVPKSPNYQLDCG
jgi:hypothetical protein